MRVALVAKHWHGEVIDVGIGGGRFVSDRGPLTWGYDINPSAVDWLVDGSRFRDPYAGPVGALTFWDSLEHIHDPSRLLENVRKWIFVSLPIFTGCEDVLRSKHFRRDEHCWYFTADGLEEFMRRFGFALVERNQMEQAAGREQIDTFVFERK